MKQAGLKNLLIGLTFGLSSGFVLANVIDRTDERVTPKINLPAEQRLESSQSQVNSSENSGPKLVNSNAGDANKLSDEELHEVIARADKNKDDLKLQRNLGIALFKYASLEQNGELMLDVIRFLERADKKAFSKDKELYETLGDALFINGKQDNAQIHLAREAYLKGLKVDPQNADLKVNIGVTYFSQNPPNPSAALSQYNQALILDLSNERALENKIIALIALKKNSEARKNIKRLAQVNPRNSALNDLQTQINQTDLTNKQRFFNF